MKKFLLFLALPLMLLTACKDKIEQPEPKPQEDVFPEHADYRVYVVDETGWPAIALYMWGAVNDLGGKWPGIQSGGTVTVKEQEYKWFSVPVADAYGCAEQLIFNNNNGGKQLADVPLTFGDAADYFFTVTDKGVSALNIKTGYTVEADHGPISATAEKIMDLVPSGGPYYNIYQVNPKLYGNNGAFKAIEGRLDDIVSLGCDVLYLMPIYTQGKQKSVGSPYCVADFKAVNTSYGSLDDLRSLVNSAHSKGLKVMFDWVANHTAWDCAWVTAHPSWYKKDGSGNIVCPTADGTWSDVAQLDYSNHELWDAMTDAMCYWLTELDIDGYRCDYAHGITGNKAGDFDSFWKEAIGALRTLKPGFVMLAESDFDKMYDDGFNITYSRATRSRLIEAYGNGRLQNFFNTFSSAAKNRAADQSKLVFVTNHDEASNASPVQDFRTADGALGAFILMRCLPASNLLYGSQEVAFPGAIDFCKNVSVSWTSNADYFARFKSAMQTLSGIDMSGKIEAWAAGPVAILVFQSGAAVYVNTSASEVNFTMQGHSGTITLAPYGFLFE